LHFAIVLQHPCQGETVTVRLPSLPLKENNIAWGSLFFHDGSQKTLAGFAVWLSLAMAAQIPGNKDDLKLPQMQCLIGSLLRMPTVVKSSVSVSDDVDSMVSRIVKQNSDSKIQPVSALAWCSILRSMGDAVTYEALMQKYNSHPEVAAYEMQGGVGSISLDNKKRQAGGFV
jgi:hypothetical protein